MSGTTRPTPGAGAHLYLHVPYCAAKCPYCDFNSIAGRADEYAAYVDALIAEVAGLPAGPYGTLFLGGGTPSMLGPVLAERLMRGLRRHLRLQPDYEWTCEANPGSADLATLQAYCDHGVNRLSFGVQAVQDHHLRWLGRVHDAAAAEAALQRARALAPRVSADLIIGLPGQRDDEIDDNLRFVRRHALDHVSVYHLMIEPGTEFAARHRRGELHPADEEQGLRHLERIADGLAAIGLQAYETSNFAIPGQACRHNLAYWTGRDYQAAGAGAVSTIDDLRLTREPHPARYIAAITAGGDAIWKREKLGPAERLTECWMLGLRLATGVSQAALASHGDDPARWRPIADGLVTAGLLHEDDGYLALTRRGRMVQDAVTVQLLP